MVDFSKLLKNKLEQENNTNEEVKKVEPVLLENQIELPNGKIITLNEQQVSVLKGIKEWLSIPVPYSLKEENKSDLFCTLAGYAGTGKTTIVKEAIKNVYGIGVSAPTHKAKKVIMKATSRPAVTIQSLLGLQPNTDLENFNINKPQFDPLREPQIADYKTIIIDEASMFNSDLFDLLIEEAYRNRVRILFMGDPAQLPPVKENISKVFTSKDIGRKYTLTKVERQADGNPLMVVYDAIRSDISSIQDKFDHISNINDKGEGIKFYKELEEFKSHVIEVFKSPEYELDKDHCKVVSWTNEQVRAWNKIVRNALFEDKDKPCVVEGDLVMSYNAIQGSYGQPLIENSSDFIIRGVREWTNEFGIKGFKVTLRDLDGFTVNEEIFIVKPLENNYETFLEEFNDKLAYAKKVRGSAWKAYYEFKHKHLLLEDLRDKYKRLIVKKDLDYGYAITVHKSQGSTYNTVFVTENVIDQNPLHEERNKLKYVAFSRPTKLAVSLSGKTIE